LYASAPQSWQLLAFGFANASMLFWLAAAAVPVLIHLWNRRRYREVSWAAVEYLMAALAERSRRLRIEQWLLLAVQTLIVMLVVLAAAQPYFRSFGKPFAAGQRTLKLLVIGGSLSMAYREGEESRFDRARDLARQVVQRSSEGDGFALVLMAERAVPIVSVPTLESDSFLKEIDELRPQHGGADLAGAIGEAAQIVRQAKATGLARSEIYFITDLARANWATALAGGDAGQGLQRLAQSSSLVLLDVGQAGASNLAVVDLRIGRSKALVRQPTSITAEIKNFSDRPAPDLPVQLWVDGAKVAERKLTIRPRGQASATFVHRFEAPGERAVEVRIAKDALPVDDRRYLVVDVREQIQVLCIDGKPDTGSRGATYFLARALNPDPTAQPPSIQLEVTTERGLLDRTLDRYDCVFLCNVAQFTTSEAQVLHRYLVRGGGLVFFLGDEVIAERYNRELGISSQNRVLPADVGQPKAPGKYVFDPLGYRHPLVRAFRGQGEAGLLTTPVYRYVHLKRAPSAAAQVALAFEGGDPAIVEEPIGQGRSIVVATDDSMSSIVSPGETPWSNMQAWPSYVPLVHELLAFASSGRHGDRSVLVGQPLTGPVSDGSISSQLTIRTPEGRRVALAAGAPHASGWSFSDTGYSGYYKVEGDESTAGGQLFAVNVDARHCDLTPVAADRLPFSNVVDPGGLADEHLPAASAGQGGAVHKQLLYAALALLLFETSLAWWFGHSAYARSAPRLA